MRNGIPHAPYDADTFARFNQKISGKIDQGMGRVFRFRDPQSCYNVRTDSLVDTQAATYTTGKVGLWTKTDSVNVFNNLTVLLQGSNERL